MFAVIYIPDFALQAVLRHEPELAARPVALLDTPERQTVVKQLTRAARLAGVTEGLTPTQAMARCAHLVMKSRSLPQETAAREVLIQIAYNFSPRLEATADGVVTMDLQGLPLSAADEIKDWAMQIHAAFARVELNAQIGIAATPDVAFYAARCAAPVLVVERADEFVPALPVEVLEPTPEVFGLLRRWGIRTVSAFVALGKERVVERLGLDALKLFRRADTETVRPLKLVTPSETFSESMDFAHEIETLEPLLFVLNRFVGQLAARLDVLGLVVAGLDLRIKLASGAIYERLFEVPAPTSQAETLFRMLHTHLETVRTDAPIVALELIARPSDARAYQFGLFEAKLRNPNQFHHTLARLSALCGAGNMGTPVQEDSFRPDAFQMETPQFESPHATTTGDRYLNMMDATVVAGAFPGLRLRRFRPPFHADVELQNDAPKFIASLRLNGTVEAAAGPWRSSGYWWEPSKLWNRDTWDVQASDGTLYRIFCECGEWFVEGIYD